MNQQITPYPLRLEPSLRGWIEKRAKRNDRSMHSEVLNILKAEQQREEAEQQKAA